MPLSSESYRRIERLYGYRVEALEKVARLGELLQTLDSEPKLADCLALRGGTALNLGVANRVSRLDRLAEEDFSNNLLPMLVPGTERDRDSLVESAKSALAPLFDLQPHHLEFVEDLDRGDLRPELIFPPEDADRLSRPPISSGKSRTGDST